MQRSLLFAGLLLPLFTTTAIAQHSCQTTKHGHSALRGELRSDEGELATWPWDLHHQRIDLDLTLGNIIRGACTITATPRAVNTTELPLHLLALTVDSVTTPQGTLAFSQAGELLTITTNGALGTADTLEVTVHYYGDPVTDPSGFGGFYTTSPYTYNLGVAFQSVPHSFGRAWFPCVDNFTERNSYEFLVKTNAGRTAWCNGELLATIPLGGDTTVYHWRHSETIPAYLASVAASNYVAARDTFISITGTPIPVALVARPQDTTAMKNSFLNLRQAFDGFEQRFGPYRWNKVGYVLTTQGAMEHSTSIHYPASIADGTLAFETIMAHELAHQWFGDLVTCERAEEMYINEGGAEFLSFLFLEEVYGRERYMQTVRSNHRAMVQRAHILDEGWWSLADMPQDWTYGEHTYNKGADIWHTLRGYMGDEAFFQGLTSFLETYAYQAVNTSLLRDHLTSITGIPLTDFFNDHVLQPGWAAFEVDSFTVQPAGTEFTTTAYIQQKQRGPSQPYNQVPMSFTCYSASGEAWTAPEPVLMGGPNSIVTVQAPFAAAWVALNVDERIAQAVTVDSDTLTTTGNILFQNADLRITVNSLPSPIPIRVEEYWVAADPEYDLPYGCLVSPDRWWRVQGVIPADAVLNGRILYDGRPNLASSADVELMQDGGTLAFREDSLVLLFRPDASWPWSEQPDHTVNVVSNPTDRQGRIDFNGLRAGDYAIGWKQSATQVREGSALPELQVAYDRMRATIQVIGAGPEAEIRVIDGSGRIVISERTAGTTSVASCATGAYRVQVRSKRDGWRTAGSFVHGL